MTAGEPELDETVPTRQMSDWFFDKLHRLLTNTDRTAGRGEGKRGALFTPQPYKFVRVDLEPDPAFTLLEVSVPAWRRKLICESDPVRLRAGFAARECVAMDRSDLKAVL